MYKCKNSLVLAIVFVSFVSGYNPPKKTTIQCDSDSDCASVPFTNCVDNTAYTAGVCSCTRQYVLRQQGNNFECLEEAKLFSDPCRIHDQCKPKFGESAACIENKCRCSPGAHFINLKCWKSSKLGETCGDPFNCVATEHSQCDGRCSCVPGYIGNPASTKCLKIAGKLGDGCEDSIQCKSVNNQASCQYNVCLCPQGYIQQGNSCFKAAKLLNDPCQINDQCAKFGQFSACIQNKCRCSSGAHYTNSMCWKSSNLGDTCSSSNNCVTEHTQCNGRCSCMPGYIVHPNPFNPKCLRIANQLGDVCEDPIQCKLLNSEASCQYNICSCPQGYIQQGNSCFKVAANLGDDCLLSTQCTAVNRAASCRFNICSCPPGYAPQWNNDCVKTAPPPPPRDIYVYNSAVGLKKSLATIFTALVMLVLKH